ncbi:NAD-dependent epimerase/dehydratase family protein [Gynuella sunshinyii]|uniref:Nucleoside-diphosphate-sugar epimerase n=1 Tax=Gynuella sunshinyii YC6258 TaxID=1445510 RepID=A0A0C5VEF5_9GAMM|nr:NAD-dependent epimerase/dehydratase family protein [Gynuella sunshinyii]AJQ92932.1 nucleoside-diphosphate-sugar epimerase [Gynuella sunshinyii YC6258]
MTKHYSLIILGAGDLGSRLAQEAQQNNLSVLAVKRSRDDIPRSYDMKYLDLTSDIEQLADYACDIMVYCVAASDRSVTGYRQSYYHGLKQALATITHQHCLFVSSTRVYGQNEGEWVDEQSPAEPADSQGEVLKETEQLLAEQDCSVRLAGIYGPERTRMIRLASQGSRTEQTAFGNRIHVEDAVALISFLCNRWRSGQANPGVVLGCDGQGASQNEVLTWLQQQLNVDPQESAKLTMSKGKRCHSSWLQQAGFQFRYPDFQTGYAALLQDRTRY